MITEMFMTICLMTNLACNEIVIKPYQVEHGEYIEAKAYRTNLGNRGILIDEVAMRTHSEREIKGLLVHEIAHFIVWEDRPFDGSHNIHFERACRKLAKKAGAAVTNCRKYS